jgi:hypothetical protein
MLNDAKERLNKGDADEETIQILLRVKRVTLKTRASWT